MTPCFVKALFLRYLVLFTVMKDDKFDAWPPCIEVRARGLDPKIHRVPDDEARTFHLIEHMPLQRGRDVSKQNEIRLAIRFGQRGFEMFKDVEPDRTRFACVQVP